MLVVNVTVFSQAGFFFILLAPLAWLVKSIVRARALGARLRRLGMSDRFTGSRRGGGRPHDAGGTALDK
jgi:hypothetical protein